MTVTRHGPGRTTGVRRYTAVLLAVPVLTACGSSVAASASPGPSQAPAARCGAASGRTLAASPTARVYVAHGVVYGCATRTSKVYRLGSAQSCFVEPRIGPVTLAGRIAAYAQVRCGVDTASSQVVVRDLADGKVLMSHPAISHVPGPESFESVHTIVAKRDGSIAWLAGVSSIGRPTELVEVHRVDRQGSALLDSGGAIAPGSLRLHGSTVTWRDRGKSRRAALN
ncbi:MAG TPA: hypothetical protein VIX82_17100 [Solirubrobacteraceae bacterium]